MGKAAEAFRTIGEVADDLDVKKHVLRFWEGKFPAIKPMKRGGGRRYYRPEDMALLRGIRHLLHAEGYTIKGVQKLLREQGIEHVKAAAPAIDEAQSVEPRRRGRRPIAATARKSRASERAPQAQRTLPGLDVADGTEGELAVGTDGNKHTAAQALETSSLVRPTATRTPPSQEANAPAGKSRDKIIGNVLIELKTLRAFVAAPFAHDEGQDVPSANADDNTSAATYIPEPPAVRSRVAGHR